MSESTCELPDACAGWTDITISHGGVVVCSPSNGIATVNIETGAHATFVGTDKCCPVGIEWSNVQQCFFVTCRSAELTGVVKVDVDNGA